MASIISMALNTVGRIVSEECVLEIADVLFRKIFKKLE
jgi:hypothetical protein